tara:strand:- start:47472 stop:47996 length:525 start_codon:yes stop_codon:yes gene_type:complete
MNGSKSFLLLLILILSLLPWGFLFVLLNSDKGVEILGIESVAEGSVVLTEEDFAQKEQQLKEFEEKFALQQQEIADLKAAAEAGQTENPLISAEDLTELNESIRQLERDNRLATGEIERLKTEYNSALSEVVRLKTQQMAAEAAPAPPPAPEPQAAPAPRSNPDPGGWILPPAN